MIIDKIITISSAIIRDEVYKILLLRRGESSSFSGQWQLPEGKIEQGETPIAALHREISEEIGRKVTHAEFHAVTHAEIEAKGNRYLCIRLVYEVKIDSADVTLSDEHSAFDWVDMQDMSARDLMPGMSDVLAVL